MNNRRRRRRIEAAIDEAWALLTAGGLLVGAVWAMACIVGARM